MLAKNCWIREVTLSEHEGSPKPTFCKKRLECRNDSGHVFNKISYLTFDSSNIPKLDRQNSRTQIS